MRNMALCRRCGNSFDIDFEPALTCHVGDDDWTVLPLDERNDLEADLLDLTDAWHEYAFDTDIQLEDVIRARTGWNRMEFGAWATFGRHAEVRR